MDEATVLDLFEEKQPSAVPFRCFENRLGQLVTPEGVDSDDTQPIRCLGDSSVKSDEYNPCKECDYRVK